jgi:hypothetical protein
VDDACAICGCNDKLLFEILIGPRRSIAEVKNIARVLFSFFDSEMIDRRIARDE